MKVKILRVRLKEAAPVGKGAVVEKHIGFDSRIDGKAVELTFDKDTRFVRVQPAGEKYFELIPVANISSLMACSDE
jgi:hypothetical protein